MAKYDDPPYTRWALVITSSKYILIASLAGYRTSVGDPKGYHIILDPKTSDKPLGDAVLTALSKSRFVDPDIDSEIFDYHVGDKVFDDWVNEIMERCGYNSKRQALRKAPSCNIKARHGRITIEPLRQIGMERWQGIGDDQIVAIHEMATAERVGAALRLALSRCR
jgi:hypothetical protein